MYWNQAAAAYSSLYFFIFLSFQFSTLKILSHFSRELWGLEDRNLVHTWTVGRCIMCTGIRLLLLLIRPFISSFFFLSNFQHWNFSSHFSRELWGLEDWKLVHTWTVDRCIIYKVLLLIHPFISSFFILSSFQTLIFFAHFSQELWGLEDWNLVHIYTVGGLKNITDLPTCRCGSSENTQHFVFYCNFYQRQRTIFLNSVAIYHTPTLNLLLNGDPSLAKEINEDIFKHVHEYILDSKRF